MWACPPSRRAPSLFRWRRRRSSFCLRCLLLSIPAVFGFVCSALTLLNAGFPPSLNWCWTYGSHTSCRPLWPSVFASLLSWSTKLMPMPALTPLQLDSEVLSVFRQVRPYFSSTCFLLLIWSASAIGYRLPAYPNTSSRVGSYLPSSLCSGSFIRCFPQHIRLCTFRLSATMPPVTLRHGKAFPWLGACATCFPVSAFGNASGTSRCTSTMCQAF